jgi:hypothetical protein
MSMRTQCSARAFGAVEIHAAFPPPLEEGGTVIDWSDGDQLLRIVVIGLVVFVIAGIGVLFLAGSTANQQDAAAPDVAWTLTQINETHVEIRHTGGPPLSTQNLSVNVDGTPTEVAWSNRVVIEGESGIVRVGTGDRVAILWQRAPRDRVILDRWQIGE